MAGRTPTIGKGHRDRTSDARLPAARPASDGDYEVGYGKPPKHSRFKAGQSGNPRGRPKGAKNYKPEVNTEWLQEIVLEEAFRTIRVRDGDRQVDVPMAQAVVRTLAVNAAKGNNRTQKFFIEMLAEAERLQREQHKEFLRIVIEYKINAENVIRECEANGRTPPQIYPHPSDILIDFETGDVRIVGPMCTEEASAWGEARMTVRGGYAEACRLRANAEPGHDTAILDKLIAIAEGPFARLLFDR